MPTYISMTKWQLQSFPSKYAVTENIAPLGIGRYQTFVGFTKPMKVCLRHIMFICASSFSLENIFFDLKAHNSPIS